MKTSILFFLLTFTLTLYSQNSKIDWHGDIEILKAKLPENHYDFSKLDYHDQFAGLLSRVESESDTLPDIDVALKLQQVVARLGDSHTNVAINKFIDRNQILPLHFYWFKDGIYITRTTEAYKKLLGQKLLEINGIPVETVVDSLSTLVTVDNRATVKSKVPNLIPLVQFLKFFGIAKNGDIELRLENNRGKSGKYRIRPAIMDGSNMVKVEPESTAICFRNPVALFSEYEVKSDHILYVQYNRCWSREYLPPGYNGSPNMFPSFVDFSNRVIGKIKNDSIEKVIIDLRFNTGGNSMQGTEFARKISALDNINKKGKLYVITGRETFSSALLNALDLKEMTAAIFVGEETAGKPNHFGEVRQFTLPSSGIIVSYSTKYFQRTKEDLDSLEPDHVVEMTFEDYKKGIDPVFEWIVKH